MASPTLPQWYTSLVELKVLLDSGDWTAVHQASKNLIKQLYADAPTVKIHFETVVLTSMEVDITEEQKKKILTAYNLSLKAAKKELETPIYNRVVKEEDIADQLSIVNTHISTSWRIVWNYWRGDNAGDYIQWKNIGKELSETPMTRMGRLRLMARHANIGNRITPGFTTMMVQLWPLALLWVIKKVGPLLVSALFKKQLAKRKVKKQMTAFQSKLGGGGFSIGSLKKPGSRKRSKKKSRRKRT